MAEETACAHSESLILREANEKLAQPGDPPLLPGESMQVAARGVSYLCPFHGVMTGTLFLSTYKLVFMPSESEGAVSFDAPHGTINTVEKVGGASSKGEHSYCLDIQFKDFRSFRFAFKTEGHSRRVIYETLQRLAFPLTSGRPLFAYEYGACSGEPTEAKSTRTFNMMAELTRIGVPREGWRISTINENYEFCPTYPSVLAVPSAVTDSMLEGVASFRSRSRIPVLSWMHPVNSSSLSRASQPQVGKFGKRSKEDESYLEDIAKVNPHSKKLVIIDARPKLNAIANKAMGGGYEDEEHYHNMELVFLDIGNIHVMRDSLRKVRDMCFPTVEDSHWMSNLENTHWLDHIKLVLAGACQVVELMDHQRTSVMVHCSDGWDRTAQVCSLAMLLMDPHYRTIDGFATLVEKEWLAFGHKFQQRIGHGDRHSGDEQRSPIFVQFIEAVWQLITQFPCAFQFNEHYLLTILDHLFSCLFGTFLANCEKDRNSVKENTVSLWAYLAQHVDEYTNPFFDADTYNHVLYPVVSIRRLQFWSAYHMRWQPYMRPHGSPLDQTQELYRICVQLQKKCKDMRQELDERSVGGS